MTRRHAAASALLGWYLLLPPDVGKPLPDTSLPLAMWKRAAELGSLPDCEQARKTAIADFEKQEAEYAKIAGDPKHGWIAFHHDEVYRSLCISSDDSLFRAK